MARLKGPGGRFIQQDDLVRFWEKTRWSGKCVLWLAGKDKDGYGKFATGGSRAQTHHRAHRWIYERVVGPIPAGLVLRHRCHVPACVNPLHLRPGTQADNIRDRDERRRAV